MNKTDYDQKVAVFVSDYIDLVEKIGDIAMEVDVFVILFLGLGALLLIEAQFHKKESYRPILNELFKNHGV
jgi:hypothetical protein